MSLTYGKGNYAQAPEKSLCQRYHVNERKGGRRPNNLSGSEDFVRYRRFFSAFVDQLVREFDEHSILITDGFFPSFDLLNAKLPVFIEFSDITVHLFNKNRCTKVCLELSTGRVELLSIYQEYDNFRPNSYFFRVFLRRNRRLIFDLVYALLHSLLQLFGEFADMLRMRADWNCVQTDIYSRESLRIGNLLREKCDGRNCNCYCYPSPKGGYPFAQTMLAIANSAKCITTEEKPQEGDHSYGGRYKPSPPVPVITKVHFSFPQIVPVAKLVRTGLSRQGELPGSATLRR